MTDLRSVLHEAATPRHRTPPPAFQVGADLDRGRRALRRSRTVVGVRSGLAAAAAAAVVAVAVQGGVGPTASPVAAPPVPALTAPGAVDQVRSSFTLVTYQGEQPEGYLIERIPEGWEVQASQTDVLALRYVGGPLVERFTPVISIFQVESDDPGFGSDYEVVAELPVGGLTGQVFRAKEGEFKDLQVEYGDGDSPHLQVRQPSGRILVITVPGWLGWTDQQVAEFGANITITGDAVANEGEG